MFGLGILLASLGINVYKHGPVGGPGNPGAGIDNLLLEDNDHLLLESDPNDVLILEP
jgi:hypothetical protein